MYVREYLPDIHTETILIGIVNSWNFAPLKPAMEKNSNTCI